MATRGSRATAFAVFAIVTGCFGAQDDYCDPTDEYDSCNQVSWPPNPRCEGKMNYRSGSVLVHCNTAGVPYDRTDCAETDQPGLCVVGEIGVAFCAETAAPDPRCAGPDPFYSYCEADVLTECREGFVERTTACTAACVTNDFRAFCALSNAPDPRCSDPPATLDLSICDNNWVIKCIDGYASPFMDCESSHCYQSRDHAQCL